jgi:hypothetical protein
MLISVLERKLWTILRKAINVLMKICLPYGASPWKVFSIPQVQSQCILDIVIHQNPPILQPLVIER